MDIKARIKILFFFMICILYSQISGMVSENKKTITADLYSALKSLPGVFVKKINAIPGFEEEYEIGLIQPVDHQNPSGAKFVQRIFISHRNFENPVVFETEGYGVAWPKEKEITKILNANQVIVEHRYFGSSKPKALDWKYLTTWQAASDHHRIVELLKKIYLGKWISSGRSKGGMTALFHHAYYPDEVDATVAYVSPIILGPSDLRIEQFMNSVGNKSDRERIKQFQIACLQRKIELLQMLKDYSEKQNITYPCNLEEAFERIVIEFPYSFWCGNYRSDDIPPLNVSKEAMFEFLNRVSSFSNIGKASLEINAPLYYQQFTELGYFNYPVSYLAGLLYVLKEPHFSYYVPMNERKMDFNKNVMTEILNYLQNFGNNIIYLYGEYDVWTSCSVELNGRTNALKYILKGKGHRFNIKDFPESERNEIVTTLKNWLR